MPYFIHYTVTTTGHDTPPRTGPFHVLTPSGLARAVAKLKALYEVGTARLVISSWQYVSHTEYDELRAAGIPTV